MVASPSASLNDCSFMDAEPPKVSFGMHTLRFHPSVARPIGFYMVLHHFNWKYKNYCFKLTSNFLFSPLPNGATTNHPDEELGIRAIFASNDLSIMPIGSSASDGINSRVGASLLLSSCQLMVNILLSLL